MHRVSYRKTLSITENEMESIKKLFYLNPKVTFLNHGSLDACPKPVMDVYQKQQIELEK